MVFTPVAGQNGLFLKYNKQFPAIKTDDKTLKPGINHLAASNSPPCNQKKLLAGRKVSDISSFTERKKPFRLAPRKFQSVTKRPFTMPARLDLSLQPG